MFQSSPSVLRLPGAFWAERTPVHEAARSGEIHQLHELIGNGACINLVTYDSVMPLQEASLRGQTRCIEILLAMGAQVRGEGAGLQKERVPAKVYFAPGTPLRLSQLCRLSLRQALGRTALEKIPHLHIPTKLVEFLSYSQ
ncbi:hypothetical protein NXF25_013277 [Crotalus adamanteus]|uniref:SOCS box domain-containing protein n=1 Tax=Crotalus adamanteus TaxID=8729 RepID=A0AAW1BE12_CROAD